MSTQRKIVIEYTNPYNEKKTKTFSYANPNATDEQLLNFSEDCFTNLTVNSVNNTKKVDTTVLERE